MLVARSCFQLGQSGAIGLLSSGYGRDDGVMASHTCSPEELSDRLGQWAMGEQTLPEELAAALANLIDDGLLPAGVGLPPQRGLASALSVSRGVVTAAYASLEGRGYVLTIQGAGSRVSSAGGGIKARTGGRLFSFTSAPSNVIDLSTGALPASKVAREVTVSGLGPLTSAHLETDGYFPSGLPILRQAIADYLTRDGLPTDAGNILVTAGAQQAAWLAISTFSSSGDLIVAEEPTYRGALEAMRARGARVHGVPLRSDGLDVEQVRHASRKCPALLYCQTAVHNPTGRVTSSTVRRDLGMLANDTGLLVVDDRSMGDLVLTGVPVAPHLARHIDPSLLVTIGTLSKLFWGGLRLGWIRATPDRIAALGEVRKGIDLGCSVMDQLLAVDMLERSEEARQERRSLLTAGVQEAQAALSEIVPAWTWEELQGGTGLWVDTQEDAVAMAERAKRVGVRLAAGPSFSAYHGQRRMLRLPVWHEREQFTEALRLIAGR